MMIWKMQNRIEEQESPEWETLLRSELGETIHPRRKIGFCLARQALRELMATAGISVQVSDLVLQHYHHLDIAPQYTISLTHTASWGAAIIGPRAEFVSLGIDIEPQERVVKDVIRERIANEKDSPLLNLELWCLKEAAFKAAMNTGRFSRPIEFSDIVIEDRTWSYPQAQMRGEWDLSPHHGHLVARAFMRTQNS